MKYILKYEIKSKYSGFKKISYKEFNYLFEVFKFLTNNQVKSYAVYEKQNVTYTQMAKGDNEIHNI